jgi:hypothetical protein
MRIAMWGSTPLPWYVFYEFIRQICIGCVVTFGPSRAPAASTWDCLLACEQPSRTTVPEFEDVLRT